MQEVPLDQWRQDAHTFRGFEEQRSRGSLGGGETFSNLSNIFLITYDLLFTGF